MKFTPPQTPLKTFYTPNTFIVTKMKATISIFKKFFMLDKFLWSLFYWRTLQQDYKLTFSPQKISTWGPRSLSVRLHLFDNVGFLPTTWTSCSSKSDPFQIDINKMKNGLVVPRFEPLTSQWMWDDLSIRPWRPPTNF